MHSHSTDFVLDAFAKAYETAQTNFDAATALRDRGIHGPATSLAVLSLEEVGKMMLLDGLLFARSTDDRHRAFTKGHLSHRSKLETLELFPLFLHYFTTVDPRQSEQRYKKAIVLVLSDLKEKRHRLSDRFGEGFALPELDSLKQRGFYSHHEGTRCMSNQQGVSLEEAQAVIDLAWRVVDALRFILTPSLEAYRESFVSLRSKIDSETLLKIRESALRIVEDVFDQT